jgi:hypothetical protein
MTMWWRQNNDAVGDALASHRRSPPACPPGASATPRPPPVSAAWPLVLPRASPTHLHPPVPSGPWSFPDELSGLRSHPATGPLAPRPATGPLHRARPPGP